MVDATGEVEIEISEVPQGVAQAVEMAPTSTIFLSPPGLSPHYSLAPPTLSRTISARRRRLWASQRGGESSSSSSHILSLRARARKKQIATIAHCTRKLDRPKPAVFSSRALKIFGRSPPTESSLGGLLEQLGKVGRATQLRVAKRR